MNERRKHDLEVTAIGRYQRGDKEGGLRAELASRGLKPKPKKSPPKVVGTPPNELTLRSDFSVIEYWVPPRTTD